MARTSHDSKTKLLGAAFPNPGVTLTVEKNRRLVFTDVFTRAWVPSPKAFMTVELTFEALSATRIRYTARVLHWSAEDKEAHENMGFYDGWGQCTSQLEAVAQSLPFNHDPFLGNCTRSYAMSYVDGFVLAVPTANREMYKAFAAEAAPIFKEYGAINVVECWGSDVPEGEITSFTMAVKRKDDESVVFSWITWPSKKQRDEAWEKMMQDPRFDPAKNPMPFDGKRMIYGGFEKLLDV